ncbi:MAG: aldo/keto reductase [Verrucomicrobia bacterium]|nr:aldo/keto reductase [Verrucomicrobiota bacterium]
MRYRTLGGTGKEISLLSFGGGRLPDDEDEAAVLVSAAAARGINYFETAPGYCGGTCERKIGLGLKAHRESVFISAKSMVDGESDGDSLRRKVEASLQALQVDYLDFYHFWAFGWRWWDHARKPGGALEAVRKLQHEGVIRHFGFTSHDSADNVMKLMATGEFECATLQYSILSAEQERAIAYANAQGIGTIAMCPLAGGLLVDPAKRLRAVLPDSAEVQESARSATSAEFALRFVWSCEGMTAAVSGIATVAELDENVAIADRFEPLVPDDRERVHAILREFSVIGHRFCTGCHYCMPCPNGVWIPSIFRLLNYARMFKMIDPGRWQYGQWPEEVRAEACTECGQCEPKCPHGVPIMAQLKEAAELFGDRGTGKGE